MYNLPWKPRSYKIKITAIRLYRKFFVIFFVWIANQQRLLLALFVNIKPDKTTAIRGKYRFLEPSQKCEKPWRKWWLSWPGCIGNEWQQHEAEDGLKSSVKTNWAKSFKFSPCLRFFPGVLPWLRPVPSAPKSTVIARVAGVS